MSGANAFSIVARQLAGQQSLSTGWELEQGPFFFLVPVLSERPDFVQASLFWEAVRRHNRCPELGEYLEEARLCLRALENSGPVSAYEFFQEFLDEAVAAIGAHPDWEGYAWEAREALLREELAGMPRVPGFHFQQICAWSQELTRGSLSRTEFEERIEQQWSATLTLWNAYRASYLAPRDWSVRARLVDELLQQALEQRLVELERLRDAAEPEQHLEALADVDGELAALRALLRS